MSTIQSISYVALILSIFTLSNEISWRNIIHFRRVVIFKEYIYARGAHWSCIEAALRTSY